MEPSREPRPGSDDKSSPRNRLNELIAENRRLKRELNVKQQMLQQQKLGDSRFVQLFDSPVLGVLVAGPGKMILEANDTFLNMLGYERSELPIEWSLLTPPEWEEADSRAVEELRKSSVAAPWEKEYFHKNGSRIPVMVGMASMGRAFRSCVAFVLDLRDRKQEARAYENSESRLRMMLDALPVMVSYVDRELRYQFNNALYESWFGISRGELRGREIREVLGDTYEKILPYVKGVLAGEPQSYDVEMPFPDGQRRQVHADFVPDFDSQDQVCGFFVLVNDLTERKQVEDLLQRGDRLASVGTLASGIAHELNNPLATILLAAENAIQLRDSKDRKDRDELVDRCLEMIERNSRRCRDIISNILRLSKQQPSERWPSDLNLLIQRAVEMTRPYASRFDAMIDLDLADAIPQIELNPIEIERVLVNLIHNGIESREGGAHLRLASSFDGDAVHVSISDDGDGMTREELAHIFDPYYTTRQQLGGTGLGLSLARSMILGHGGNIDVESERGVGTRVRIDLPLQTRSKDADRGELSGD